LEDLKGYSKIDFSLFRTRSMRNASVHLLQGVNRRLWHENKARLVEDPDAKMYEYCIFKSMAFVEYRDKFKELSRKLRIFR